MKKLLALTLAVLMLATLVACGEEEATGEDLKDYLQNEEVVNFETLESGETYYFDQVDSETVTITSYKCSNEKHALVIPQTLAGKTVVGISEQAFKANNDITSVTIPATVTWIDAYAFAECAQITSVTIPATVTSIGEYAFVNCTALETVVMETISIDEIKEYTFYGCTALTEITVPGNVKKVGTAAYHGCSSVKTIVIEEGVEVIGQQAFQNCSSLTSLTLPASLTEIGKQAFSGAPLLYIDSLFLAEGATVAQAYFATEGYELSERPAPEPEKPDEEVPETNVTMPEGYKAGRNSMLVYAYRADWMVGTSNTNTFATYTQEATGNAMVVSVKAADQLLTDYSALTTENFATLLKPALENLGAKIESATVSQEHVVENAMDVTKIEFTNANVIPDASVKQTLLVYSNGENATVILITEAAPVDGLVDTVLSTLRLPEGK